MRAVLLVLMLAGCASGPPDMEVSQFARVNAVPAIEADKPLPDLRRSAPVPVTAICRDASFSYSKQRRGTCIGHGGVAYWQNKPAK